MASGHTCATKPAITSTFTVRVFTVTVFVASVQTVSETSAAAVEPVEEWTIDEIAQRTGIPGRTIREYQTLGLLPPPRRVGRVGYYGVGHVQRLQLIGRLQDRGYSLAGIGDLLTAWRGGDALTDILGLEPDQLVHVDEPGTPATLDQLTTLLPRLVPDRLDALLATGVVEACGPDRFCVPSPSLLQLAVDALDADLEPDVVLDLLTALRTAADQVATAVIQATAQLPSDADPDAALVGRGRGLLAHGLGRLTLHRLGREVGITDADDTHAIAARLTQTRSTKKSQR